MMIPRIAAAEAPYTPEIEKALSRIMPMGMPPLVLFTTLARNPRVFQRFMAGGLLDRGSITLREREIVVNRATARCGSEYEWGVHIAFFAEATALTAAQIHATVHADADDPCWSPPEALLIRLVDALHDENTVDDLLWAELRKQFSEEQLIELIVLTGFYHMVSFVTNGLRLPLEDGAARFPA
jgi:alkylhydroperoxidase family enzyme